MTVPALLMVALGVLLIIVSGTPTVSRRMKVGIFYGWWLVGIASIVMILSIVPFFHTMTAWFVVLERHFGWNRTQLSLAFSLSRVEGGILGPLEGLLIDRLGPRRMVIIGLAILGIGFLMFSRVQELWQFYAAFLTISSANRSTIWMLWAMVRTRMAPDCKMAKPNIACRMETRSPMWPPTRVDTIPIAIYADTTQPTVCSENPRSVSIGPKCTMTLTMTAEQHPWPKGCRSR